MDGIRRVVVVHHSPMVVEAIGLTLASQGFAVHPAATFRDAKALLSALGTGIAAVVTHADMRQQPGPGRLLELVEASHPEAALVVLSARSRNEVGPLPGKAVLLSEPFDRAELMTAIVTACDPRGQALL